jgi:hypothetical protein
MDEYILVSRNQNITKFELEIKGVEQVNKKVIIQKTYLIDRIKNSEDTYYVNNKSTNRLNKLTVTAGDLTCSGGTELIESIEIKINK